MVSCSCDIKVKNFMITIMWSQTTVICIFSYQVFHRTASAMWFIFIQVTCSLCKSGWFRRRLTLFVLCQGWYDPEKSGRSLSCHSRNALRIPGLESWSSLVFPSHLQIRIHTDEIVYLCNKNMKQVTVHNVSKSETIVEHYTTQTS